MPRGAWPAIDADDIARGRAAGCGGGGDEVFGAIVVDRGSGGTLAVRVVMPGEWIVGARDREYAAAEGEKIVAAGDCCC